MVGVCLGCLFGYELVIIGWLLLAFVYCDCDFLFWCCLVFRWSLVVGGGFVV